MFPMVHRLRHEKDVARVLKSKKGAFDSACGIKMTPNGLAISRFSVVVGKKVSKSAVVRNRIRRQYREIIRLRIPLLSTGYDVLFLTAKPALTLDYAQKEAGLLRTLRKAGLLTASHSANPALPKNPVV
ncbi:TPA: ribonuclease P protein component [Candidatus Uhrbacteria bacterium]|nr:ribonuclease P protein component [Candidatus Uhrbacteria bacterium]